MARCPGCTEILKRILAGESVVWVIVDSGKPEDQAEITRIEKRLKFLENVAALPIQDPNDPDSQLGPGEVIEGTVDVSVSYLRASLGDPTVADGLRIARSKAGVILGYAAIAATVGLLLKAASEKSGIFGRIVVGLVGMAWTLASFLVVPILVTRDVGPIDAIKESIELLKRTWGENVAGNVGIGMAFGLITVLVVVLAIGLVIAAAAVGGVELAIVVGVVGALAVALVAVIQAALSGIYSAAVYRYAVDGIAPAGFGGPQLQAAFQPK